MTPEEIRALWGRFLEGEELLVDDQRRLLEALEAEPALRSELLDDVELDGVLRSLGAVRRGGEGFVQTLSGSVDRERDATRFVKKVELRISDVPPVPPARRDTPRPFAVRTLSRRYTRPGPSGAGWKAALAAAGVFAAILLFAAASTRRPKPAPSLPAEAHVPDPPPLPPRPPEPERRSEEEHRYRNRLQDLDRQQERLSRQPSAPEESPEERRRKLEAVQEERRRVEAEMRRSLEENRRSADPSKTEPGAPTAPPASPPSSTTPDRAIALEAPLIESTQGNVYLGKSKVRPHVKKDRLGPDQDLEAQGTGTAVLRYADRTWVKLTGGVIQAPADPKSRRMRVKHGTIESDIAPQDPARPMIFETPVAEARILGTSIRLTVAPTGETTLEVTAGKVAFTKLADRSTVEVTAGQFAVVSPTVEFGVRKTLSLPVWIDFGPPGTALTGWLGDSGEAFDAARGYGWDPSKDGEVIAEWRNPNGPSETRKHGRQTAFRGDGLKPEDRHKATHLIAGWGEASESWKIMLPNGWYKVTVGVGDFLFEQGPHVVAINGTRVWETPPVTKPPRNPFVEGEVVVEVRNGELKMTVGGLPVKPSIDGSKDTILNYLKIERLK